MNFGTITTFQHEIDAYSAEFFAGSRQWLDTIIDRFVADPERRFLIIVGEPGIGKTTYLAHLAQRYQCPRYFLYGGDDLAIDTARSDPRAFLVSIGLQIGQRYGAAIFGQGMAIRGTVILDQTHDDSNTAGVEIDEAHLSPFRRLVIEGLVQAGVVSGQARIAGVRIKRIFDSTLHLDPWALLKEAILDPLDEVARLYPGETVLLLLDGLDIALQQGGTRIVDVIPRADNLRVLMTSRPGDHLARFRSEDKLVLSATREIDTGDPTRDYAGKNSDDAHAYIAHIVRNDPDIAPVVRAHMPLEQYIERLAERSNGNFLYLRHFFETARADLRVGRTDLFTLEGVPGGLYDFYRAILVERIKRGVNDTRWEQVYVPVLGILAVAQDALTRGQIARFARVAPARVDTVLGKIAQFLHVLQDRREPAYRIYHTSFGEYLQDRRLNRDYPLDGPGYHHLIATAFRGRKKSWAAVEWEREDDDYPFRYLGAHLAAAGKTADLYALIDRRWMEAQHRVFQSHRAFAADVERAIAAAEAETPPNLRQLVRGRLIAAALRSTATNVPPEALGALAWAGRAGQASSIAALMLPQATDRRVQAFLQIGEALGIRGESGAARDALREALAAAQLLDDGYYKKDSVLVDAARALGRLGDREGVRRALAVAETLAESDRSTALPGIAQVLAELGDSEEVRRALAAARVIRDEAHHARALAGLAEPLLLAGQVSAARKTIDQVLEAANALPEWEHGFQGELLSRAAQALVRAGEDEAWRRAAAQLLAIPYGAGEWALLDLVQALAQAGRPGDAMDLSQQFTAEYERVATWQACIPALAQAGDRAGLRQLCDTAEATVQDPNRLVDLLLEAGQALAHLGESDALEQAAGVAEAIRPFRDQAHALGKVALALARHGDHARAATTARKALEALIEFEQRVGRLFAKGRPYEGPVVLDLIAPVLAQAGDQAGLTRVLALAAAVTDERARARVLGAIAQALAAAGAAPVISRLLAASDTIGHEAIRAYLLIKIARAAREAGAVEDQCRALRGALAAARACTDPTERTDALGAVAQALAQAGETSLAIHATNEALAAAAASVPDTHHRIAALGRLACALAETGAQRRSVDIAEQVLAGARRLADTSFKVRLLCDVAQTMALAGSADKAATIAEEVLRTAQASGREREHALATAAVGLVQVGGAAVWDLAASAAEAIPDDVARVEALSRMACALADLGETGRAMQAARTARDITFRLASEPGDPEDADTATPYRVIRCVHAVAPAIAAAELGYSSVRLFSAITHAVRQLGGLPDASTAVTVAAALAGLGKAELAVRAADTALRRIGQVEPGRIGRGQPLEELAPVLARLGQHDHLIQALEQTAGIESESERAYARAAIYTALAQIGYVDYLDRAVQDVAAVRDTDVRVAVLNRLVEANLKAERYDQALLIWRAALADAQHVGRWRVLHVIQSGAPLIRATGGAQVIWDICQLIIHIDGWWRET